MLGELEKSEKAALSIAVGFLLFFFGLLVYAAKGMNIDVPTCITDVKPFTEGRVIQHSPDRYEVHYLAYMWAFDPMEIEVPKGATVDFYLTSKDVIHGMHIEKTNVNMMAIPGTVAYARYTFTKPGEYRVICHEYCGIGHQDMMAKIIVK